MADQIEEILCIGQIMVEKIQWAVNNYYGQFETAEGRATQALHLADAVDEGELGIQMTPEPATTQTETKLEVEELNPEERLALDEVAAVPETADLRVEEAAETEPPPVAPIAATAVESAASVYLTAE